MSTDTEQQQDRGDELQLTDGAPSLDGSEQDAAAELARIAADSAANAEKEAEKEAEHADNAENDAEKGEKGEESAKKGKDSRIPLARHKDLLEKERERRAALEAELARYRQGADLARTNDEIDKAETKLVELETRYTKLLADGEIDQATGLMREIRTAERGISEQKTAFQVQAAETRAVERVRYDTVVERLEQAYPQLNPDSDAFDQDQVQDVLDLKETYERRGMTPSSALQKAVSKTFGAETGKQDKAVNVTPRVDPAQVAATRKEQATKAAIDAAKRQPASTRDVGLDSDRVGALTAKSAMGMNQDQFAKLTDDQLSAMRGDQLA
jgi:hypothetical protein